MCVRWSAYLSDTCIFWLQRLFGSRQAWKLSFDTWGGDRRSTFSCVNRDNSIAPSGTFDLDQRTATLRLPTGDSVQLALSGFGSATDWKMSGRFGDTYVELKREQSSTSPSNQAIAQRQLQPVGTSFVYRTVPRVLRSLTRYICQVIRWTISRRYSAQFCSLSF